MEIRLIKSRLAKVKKVITPLNMEQSNNHNDMQISIIGMYAKFSGISIKMYQDLCLQIFGEIFKVKKGNNSFKLSNQSVLLI